MKRLRFHYHMNLKFDSIVLGHRFTLKCVPKNDYNQEISSLAVSVYPAQFMSQGEDSFGNTVIYGFAPKQHSSFYVDVSGVAKFKNDDSQQKQDTFKIGFYKYQTSITKPGVVLDEYFKNLNFSSCRTNCDKALVIMNKLTQDFQYKKDVTNIVTTAEEALSGGAGVCQDYSHIMISLCRMAGIAARYVAGLLENEGFSHAWVEIFENDNELEGHWVSIDPTNNCMVKDSHIKISCGKDYADCLINQGIFSGGGSQSQTVSAIVYDCKGSRLQRNF